MKQIKHLLIAACILYSFSACKKENISPVTSTVASEASLAAGPGSLLLSKVTGSIAGTDANFAIPLKNIGYTYKTIDLTSGDYSLSFTYGAGYQKPVRRETFLNGGFYDFQYKKYAPGKVADSSVPGKDYGYWKFYYNNQKQIKKIGLGFSSNTDPARFEFYKWNDQNQLAGLIYGNAPDTPMFKVTYKYDVSGNLAGFKIYMPLATAANTISRNNTPDKNLPFVKWNEKTGKKSALPASKVSGYPSSDIITDGAVQYRLYLTAKITTDGNTNPFSQQHNVFFYQTNRKAYFYDPTPFFLSLLKSNPIRVEYTVPDWGPDIAVQSFSYTYNSNGYPVSIHEEFTDPDYALLGGYTQDSQIKYVNGK